MKFPGPRCYLFPFSDQSWCYYLYMTPTSRVNHARRVLFSLPAVGSPDLLKEMLMTDEGKIGSELLYSKRARSTFVELLKGTRDSEVSRKKRGESLMGSCPSCHISAQGDLLAVLHQCSLCTSPVSSQSPPSEACLRVSPARSVYKPHNKEVLQLPW